MQEGTRWEGANCALHDSSSPDGPLQGRQYVTRYCTRIAIRNGDVSCERRLFGCLYRQIEGGGGKERERGVFSHSCIPIRVSNITKRIAPRLEAWWGVEGRR
jgi:hypothetical protein